MDYEDPPSPEDFLRLEKAQVGTLNVNGKPHKIFKGMTRIGRGTMCEVQIDHHSICEIHAEIEAQRKHVFIGDLSLANQTLLNGECLRPRRMYEMMNGAEIKLGDVQAMFVLSTELTDDQNTEIAVINPERDEEERIEEVVTPIPPIVHQMPQIPERLAALASPAAISLVAPSADLYKQLQIINFFAGTRTSGSIIEGPSKYQRKKAKDQAIKQIKRLIDKKGEPDEDVTIVEEEGKWGGGIGEIPWRRGRKRGGKRKRRRMEVARFHRMMAGDISGWKSELETVLDAKTNGEGCDDAGTLEGGGSKVDVLEIE